MRAVGSAALAGAIILASCNSVNGGSPNVCTDNIPAPCGNVAHCVLDTNQYLSGNFPGSQIFVVTTMSPTMVIFSFQFDNRISAGTGLMLSSTEPDCSDQSTYMSKGDIFQTAGASGILSFPITMTEAGDHLIQFSSDAYCSYELAYQQLQAM